MTHAASANPVEHDAATPAQWASSPTVWGLSVRQLHDAYWCARGVQVIRRGEAQPLERGVELFLLVEPDQLVLFNVGELSDRLTWGNAAVTRLRIVDSHDDTYSEHVLLDTAGFVQRVERRYRAQVRGSSRVVLTIGAKQASLWMSAKSRRAGWDRIRRSVAWPRVDHHKTTGSLCREGNPAQERDLLAHLVERWPTPSQSIEGIVEDGPGVWRIESDSIASDTICVGPLWLGGGAASAGHRCLVGPLWLADCADIERDAVSVRPISQVELIEPAARPGQARQGLGYGAVKRTIDMVASALALLVFSPVMAVIAVLIVLEDGFPVLFRHQRQGRGGRDFDCLKFRTMQRNAERIAAELDEYNVSATAGTYSFRMIPA
jgi:hypothetical protein